ncbi:hypothetical protein GCM10011499_34650 [Pelagibacterium lentulum]|uniref:Uncharacterized protein n=1 Tax=Pelagibacterium lentulum TaxID=2029865 RepID=A0A916RL46_9HYPH|nr:hypothetical protein GCM10011499_34650 [Pelagibacterium lentulum]
MIDLAIGFNDANRTQSAFAALTVKNHIDACLGQRSGYTENRSYTNTTSHEQVSARLPSRS